MTEEPVNTVLIVDDEPDILEILEQTLAAAGYTVIARSDAEAALDVIRRGASVDLVITDNFLPGMKGAEFIDLLKKLAPSVPVVMLTGYGSVENYIQSMAKGVFEYVNKPVQAKELRRIAKAALEWSANTRS